FFSNTNPLATVTNVRANYYAGFLQDTFRLNRRITVDYGVRYEFQPAYYQPNNLEGLFTPGSTVSGVSQEVTGQALYHQDTWRHNFSPRAQLAWDVRGNGRTVVRVGANIMYALSTYSGMSGPQNIPTGATFFAPTGATSAQFPCSTGWSSAAIAS